MVNGCHEAERVHKGNFLLTFSEINNGLPLLEIL